MQDLLARETETGLYQRQFNNRFKTDRTIVRLHVANLRSSQFLQNFSPPSDVSSNDVVSPGLCQRDTRHQRLLFGYYMFLQRLYFFAVNGLYNTRHQLPDTVSHSETETPYVCSKVSQLLSFPKSEPNTPTTLSTREGLYLTAATSIHNL